MALAVGTRLGPYVVETLIGAGGMGEVYRARDTRLERTVAIKILSEHIASDVDLRHRFEREARVISSLDHPHICALYDIGQQDGIDFLVMQYLEGETLARHLRNGPLPIDQTLRCAIEIADALDKAHRQGIVHRDLKPGNVMLTKSGAKLLDFGLARTGAGGRGRADGVTAAPTEQGLTDKGAILGTFEYMAPEQLEGKEADARTDIFAFGVVLHEMATGRKAFEGKSRASLIAAILERDPPSISSLQPLTPPALDRIVRKCLAKDPEERWQSAHDLMSELKWISETPAQAGGPVAVAAVVNDAGGSRRTSRVAWLAAAGFAAVAMLAALTLGALTYLRTAAEPPTMRSSVSLPEGWSLALLGGNISTAPLAVSPDGRRMAVVARSTDGKILLWIRALDTLAARPLTGTDGASSPFWSPDSRFLGFFADGKLKKIEVSGGPPITLCDAPNNLGGAWSSTGVIVFAPMSPTALQKVSESGGIPTPATVFGKGETLHWRPSFLPDGRHFLYRANTPGMPGPIYVTSLDSTDRTLLLNADSSNILYAQGHLLFLRERTLMAQAFDPRRLALTGEPVPIAEQIEIQATFPNGIFSASANGILAYQTGSGSKGSQLAWFDRGGKQIGVLGDQADYGDVELSPDRTRAAVTVVESPSRTRDIWVFDLARGLRTRLTFDPANDFAPVWSADGSRLVFDSIRNGAGGLFQKAASGTGGEESIPQAGAAAGGGPGGLRASSWSGDGRYLLHHNGGDLWTLPFVGDRKPTRIMQTPFLEFGGKFSPDGRWIAYISNESGRMEVYVAPFPNVSGKWQVSTAGGTLPRWRNDGREIFYLSPTNTLMAAEVSGQASGFKVGAVRPLFETRARISSRYPYDVSADGQRFLVNSDLQAAASSPITLVVNWTAGLKK